MYSLLKQTKIYVDNRYTPFNFYMSKCTYNDYNYLKQYAYFYKTLNITLKYYVNNYKKIKFINSLINKLPIPTNIIEYNINSYLIDNHEIKNILWWRTDTKERYIHGTFGFFSNNYEHNNFFTYKINIIVILLNKFNIFNQNEKNYYYNNSNYILYELSQLKICHFTPLNI